MTTLAALRLAREKGARLEVEAYCRHTGCPVREVTLQIKDYDRELVAAVQGLPGQALQCPVCRRPLVVHYARPATESAKRAEAEARMSVNRQMFVRDTGSPFCPVDRMLDERLPPTPTGWFDETP